MSEPLFRFVLTRPPAQPIWRFPVLNLLQDSAFQGALAQAAKSANPIQAMRDAATTFANGTSFISDPTKTPLAADLDAFSAALDTLQLKSSLTTNDFIKAVKDNFSGQDPGTVVKSTDYTNSVSKLKDSLLAIKQLQEQHPLPIEALTNQLRNLDFIANIAQPDQLGIPQTGSDLVVLRSRPLQFDLANLKSIISDRSLISAAQSAAIQATAAKKAQIQTMVDYIGNTRTALSELTAINASHIVSMTQTASAGSTAPEALLPNATFLRQANLLSQLSDISLKYLDPPATKTTTSAIGKASVAEVNLTPTTDALAAITHFTDSILQVPVFISPSSTAFKPFDRTSLALKLTPDKIKALSPVTTTVLQNENISLSTTAVDRAVVQLKTKLLSTVSSLNKTAAPGIGDSIALKMIGGALVTIRTPMASSWSEIFTGGQLLPSLFGITNDRVPQLHGNISAAGVADLLVVKQQLKAYEGADVSTIENVLKSEKRSKELTTTRTTTSVTTTQTSTTDQETKDLESTTRFEMSKETDNQIKSDQSLKAGVNISASYGPTVSLSASAEGSTSNSQTVATKAASSFSQDITEKASKTITTQVVQSTSLTITDEVVEKDLHSFDNSAGSGNISGVYQWVTKVYEAQVFNYGLRVMYDFMIPEPGAFLIELYQQLQAQAVKLDKPPDLTINPQDIDETNYYYWVALYGATDVTSPPDNFKSYAKEMSMPPSTDSNQNFDKTDEITLDAGYQALSCSITCTFTLWDQNACHIDVLVGTVVNRFTYSGDTIFQSCMNNENGSIPVGMQTFKIASVAIALEITAVRTDKAMLDWQLDTFGKLWNAHKARLQEYNDALAQLQLNAGVSVAGSDPDTNLTTMRNEIKKNCISILTDQHYDMFDAIDTSSFGLPQIDLYQNEAQGSYVRFFEEAFEWEEMTWLTYPYFWGRKSQWANRLTGVSISDPDPVFQDFLQSGYCRAVAPVRPGFETAIDHYLKYGELWNGGPLPPISDGLYVPIATEIAERLGKPDTEITQGDPWEVRIPTTLIKLRKDDSLPTWTKQPDGTWKSNDS